MKVENSSYLLFDCPLIGIYETLYLIYQLFCAFILGRYPFNTGQLLWSLYSVFARLRYISSLLLYMFWILIKKNKHMNVHWNCISELKLISSTFIATFIVSWDKTGYYQRVSIYRILNFFCSAFRICSFRGSPLREQRRWILPEAHGQRDRKRRQ